MDTSVIEIDKFIIIINQLKCSNNCTELTMEKWRNHREKGKQNQASIEKMMK